MSIKKLVDYEIVGSDFSLGFTAPADLTLAQIAARLEGLGVTIPDDPAYSVNVDNAKDAKARFLASAIARKTPAQIYTAMQGKIDGWSSLAQAKSDLREWLPLMAAAIAWLVVDQD